MKKLTFWKFFIHVNYVSNATTRYEHPSKFIPWSDRAMLRKVQKSTELKLT